MRDRPREGRANPTAEELDLTWSPVLIVDQVVIAVFRSETERLAYSLQIRSIVILSSMGEWVASTCGDVGESGGRIVGYMCSPRSR